MSTSDSYPNMYYSLQTAHGQGDAKDSTITSLNHKLNFEKMQAQKYEKQVSELEERLATIEQELSVTKQSLEDKTFALSQARKHLKNSRERTLVTQSIYTLPTNYCN